MQEHPASASLLVGGIVGHCLDALGIALPSVFVHFAAQDNPVFLHPFAGVDDVGCLASGDVVQDASSGEHDERVVHLLAGQSRAYGQGVLADVGIVGEQPRVRAQDDIDELLGVGIILLQAIELVPMEGEDETRSIVLLVGIFQVACPRQDFQGTVRLHGEVLEVTAELIEVESEGASQAVAHSHLEIIVDVLVHIAYVVLLGEGVADSLVEGGLVALAEEQHGEGLLSVASGTSCLLEVSLGRVGHIHMDHDAHVGFVDAHAEGIGGHHHPMLVLYPALLSLVLHVVVQSGMIEGGSDSLLGEQLGHLAGASAVAGIDDGRAFCLPQDVQKFFLLVLRRTDDVGQVLPFEAHLVSSAVFLES